MKTLRILILLLPFLGVAYADERANGWCEDGKKTITVNTVTSSFATPVQRSYPNCTVAVYFTGTQNKAPIYSDDGVTPLDNPFTAQGATGLWYFYAPNGRYDVQMYGSGITTPITIADWLLRDEFVINGPWNNSGPASPLIGGISDNPVTSASVDHDRFLMTNVYGSYNPNQECCRVQAVTGDIHTSQTAISYEACAICGMIFASNPLVNHVALSGFAVPEASGPEGTASLNHNVMNRISGPCFADSWAHTINTLITTNHVDNFITGVANCNQLTLAFDLGVEANIPWSRRLYMWGENLGLSDDMPGATPAGPGFSHIQEMNEWDFGVYGPDTTVVALIFGVGGTKQPTGAHGIVINGGGPDEDGNPVRWNTAITLFSNCCNAAMEIGTVTATNSGSQPIIMYARDTMSRVAAASMNTDEGGNLILDMQTDATNTLNPALIIRDVNVLNFAFTGTIGGARATLSGFQDSAFVPGQTLFADLGSGTPGTFLQCTDCKNVVTDGVLAGHECVGGGSGAVAFAIFSSRWECM